MKGYITNGKCYIFPQEAAEIPAVEATVFYVQEENFAEWVEENPDLNLVKYNYNTMTVNPKEWAGHTDDDLEQPVVQYDITYSGDTTHVTGPSTGEAGETITISPTTPTEFPDITLASEEAVITKNLEDDKWTFTMPATDVAVDVEYVEPVQKNTFKVGFISPLTDSDLYLVWNNTTHEYAVQDPDTGIYTCSTGDEIELVVQEGYTFDLESQTQDTKVKLGGVENTPNPNVPNATDFTVLEDLDLTVEVYAEPVVQYDITYSGDTTHVTGPSTSAAGATITITPTTPTEFSDITLTSSDAVITKNTDNWTFTMPSIDVAVSVAYTPAPAQTYTLTITDADDLIDEIIDASTQEPIDPSAVAGGSELNIVLNQGVSWDSVCIIINGNTYVWPSTQGVYTMPNNNTSLATQTYMWPVQTSDTVYSIFASSSPVMAGLSFEAQVNSIDDSGFLVTEVTQISETSAFLPAIGDEILYNPKEFANVDAQVAMHIYNENHVDQGNTKKVYLSTTAPNQ